MKFPLIACAVISVLLSSQNASAARLNPLRDNHICGRPQCSAKDNKFKYDTNAVYHYDYSMFVKNQFAGSSENTSQLHLTASVEVHFFKLCEGILRLSNVELRDQAQPSTTTSEPPTNEDGETEDYVEPPEIELHSKSEYLAEDLQNFDLLFAFHDGVIGEVCPNEEEKVWVLNLKKGMLSALQNTMQRFDIDYNTTETDVSGVCDVSYTVNGVEGTSLIINKTKDVRSCRSRYKTHSFFQTTPYDFRENFAAWPILNSESYCNISIDHNVYNAVTCYEKHILVPFSNNETGAVTESLTRLVLVDESKTEPYKDENEVIEHRSSLLFDHTQTERPTHGEIKSTRDYLKQMCLYGFPNIQRDFSTVFTSFLSSAKSLSYSALQQLLARSASICTNGKKHVLESLPFITSTAAVQLMRDQIVNRQVPAAVAQHWLSSMAFITRPSEETVEAMHSLLEYGQSIDEPEYTLVTTAVINTYCKMNSKCADNEYVSGMVEILENAVQGYLENEEELTRKSHEHIIILLKGLGNMGIITEEVRPALNSAIENEDLPVDIRLQVVYAFRRFDCYKTRDYFLDLYKNFSMQSEVRIAAYLQSMRCPDYLTIKEIKHVLETEVVNQVGSFVWSHITNMAKSSSPARVELQGLLVNGDFGTKFRMDMRKFSRNYEHSLFFDEYNFGASADNNLIFGTDSFIPRTASFNLTADLFGESINLFQFDARVQGFENFAELLIGPKGPLHGDRLMEAFDKIYSYFQEDEEVVDSYEDRLEMDDDDMRKRRKRSARKLAKEELEESVRKLPYKSMYNNLEPEASFGIKIFGNDLSYKTLKGYAEIMATASQLNPVNYIKQILSGREITYTKSGVFLDTSYEVPLSSGVPLAIHVLGATSIDMRLSGSLKTDQIGEAWLIDAEGKIKPSISLDVIASMQSDLFHTGTGIKVKSNLYSSSEIESKLKVRGNRLVALDFSLPQKRNDIFSARSELIVMHNDKEIAQSGIPKRYSNATCTWPIIDRAVGLKMCSEYSLPDVSNYRKLSPSLILSGPVNLDVHLDKADPTARTFAFEYRLDENPMQQTRNISFIFDTPGSRIPRVLTMKVMSHAAGFNTSMSFRNGDIVHSAVGTYLDTKLQQKFDLALTIDNLKQFSLEMCLNRTKLKYGWLLYPKVLLTVNGDNIAGLIGTIKDTTKQEVWTANVDLQFETKKLKANLVGTLTKTLTLTGTKFNLNYLFLDSKPESVEFSSELADRSQKSTTDYRGLLRLNTTAYPHFNFASTAKFLSASGHIDATVTVNNAPDLLDEAHTLTLRLNFARYSIKDGTRTATSLELKRPKSNADVKLQLKHEEKLKKGLDHNVLIVLRYAPKKEVTIVLSLLFPKGNLFALDAAMNIAVPNFDSCNATLQIYERNRKEYTINFNGLWFSGHKIKLAGLYQDRTSIVKTYHHLKLSAESPSFEETDIDVRYSDDEYELKLDVNVDYAQQPYGLQLKYSEQTESHTVSYVELRLRDKLYWLSADMLSDQPKQLTVEIHVDKIRDIHIIMKGLSNQLTKEFGVEFKWNANRDPTQRLALSAIFNTPDHRVYDGGFLIAYPDRSFNGDFNLNATGPEYDGTSRLSWSPTEALELIFNAGYKPTSALDMWLRFVFHTPFEGWKKNTMNSGFYYMNNLLLFNTTMLWADNQHLGFEVLGDYEIQDPLFSCEFRTSLNSTILDIPTASAYFKHRYDEKKTDTQITVQHLPINETLQVFSIRSIWDMDNDEKYRNISGSLLLLSPFEGYRKGSLETKFSLSDTKQLSGAAGLELEEKKFTLLVEGHIKKVTDNMLIVNITTPIEKFSNVVGRFGINERLKHIVAEVRAPSGALGIEILFAVVHLSDFDVKFNLATPLETLEKIMVVGKMKPEIVDLRVGWSKAMLGFVGVWRMNNVRDFEYSYKAYTPLEKFEENGVVVKLIMKEGMDMELTMKFAQYKLGATIFGKPKDQKIRQLHLEKMYRMSKEIDEDEMGVIVVNEEEDSEEEDEEEGEPISFDGYMELDTLLWPTLKGNLDLEKIRDTYYCFGTITLPQGPIKIHDRFFFLNYGDMKNKLKITTPFPQAKEIRSNYKCYLEMGSQYVISSDIAVLNKNWTEVGFFVNYTRNTDDDEFKSYELNLKFKTPLQHLPKIAIRGLVELEESIYRGNFSTKTDNAQISIGGSLESDDNFLDTSFGLSLMTAQIPSYGTRIFFKKYFSDVDNSLAAGIEIDDDGNLNHIRTDLEWHKEPNVFVNAKSKLDTNVIALRSVEVVVVIKNIPHPLATAEITYTNAAGTTEEIKGRAMREDEKITVELFTPLQEFRNLTLIGTLTETSANGVYDVSGNFYKNSVSYHVQGSSEFYDDVPVKVDLKIKSPISNQDGIIFYSMKRFNNNKGSSLEARIAHRNKFAQLASVFNFQNKYEWNYALDISSSEAELNKINVNASTNPTASRTIVSHVSMVSPWTHLGVDRVLIDSDIQVLQNSGKFSSKYKLPEVSGGSSCSWSWIIMENMQLAFQSRAKNIGKNERMLKTGLRYVNPKRSMQRLTIGGDLNVDDQWVLSANGSLFFKSGEDIGASAELQLPKPVGDNHLLRFQYLGNLKDNIDISYDVSYEIVEAHRRLASRGIFRNVTDMQGLLRVEWGHDKRNEAMETNVQVLRKGDVRKEMSASVSTPFYPEDTLTVSGSYDYMDIFHLFKGSLNIPASNKVGETDVAFSSLSNMKGMAKGSATFLNISWIRGDFDFSTLNGNSIRFIKASWPNNNATFDSKSTYSSHNLERDLQGVIKIEVPLETRHFGSIVYGLKERAAITTGHAIVEYNMENILNGHYTCKSESRAGHEKDVVDITLENKKKPLGIHYVHLHQYGDSRAQVYDMKRAEVFELKNSKKFNITGEIHVTNRATGQEYKIVAVHPNRTVILTSDYDYQESTTKHKSKLQLAPTVWFGYDVMVQNLTQNDNESQIFSVELSYPRRTLSAEGWYGVTEDILDSDLTIKWTHKDNSEEQKGVLTKAMRAAVQWRNEPTVGLIKNNQTASLTLSHPSLERDITFNGWFYRDPTDLMKTKLVVDYAHDQDHLLTLDASIRDLLKIVGYRNYTIEVTGNHIASELDLFADGSVGARPGRYEMLHTGHYKRGYLPMQKGHLIGLLNLLDKEIHYHKQTPYKSSKLWGKYAGKFPEYSVNGTFEDSPDYNFNGEFYLNIDGKLVKMELNMTPDASQNLQMYGIVPDTRSAFFDIWRNYEDIRVVDVAYYLKMNHSRLITSQLIWRPTLKAELKDQIKVMALTIYNSMAEGVDFWVKTLYNECVDTVGDVWNQAKPYAQGMIDDVNGLSVLEEDIEELRFFLNESYHADDFYVRSMVNFTITILDELALKNHIESFPKIIREFWQVMGESGQALRKSILWLIDTMKTSYKKTLEVIGKILHGESFQHITAMMEKALEKYDKFIKDLHLSFIKYVQNLWDKFTETIHMQFKKMLENIKPHILHLIHYVETVAWTISKELFNYLYQRTNELVDSPYFNQVSNFTQDLDRLYKDLMGNDAFTNFKKYSALAWKFAKEKYFKLVPFGKELNDLFMELYEEIRKLSKIESVRVVIQKVNEIQAQLEWLADEFQVEKRIHQLFNILRNKLSRYAQTALQADNHYREAKTKFIFDPDTGVLELEQKLPMSWHAFNETPKFEEIPEYKMINDVQNFFSSSNTTIWSLYYELRPLCYPDMWLPPFKSHALLIGSRHYMTFDKNFVAVNLDYELLENDRKPQQCSYLLSHDYGAGHFSLILEPSIYRNKDDLISSRKITLISDFELIDIDIASDVVRIGRNLTTMLPAKVGDLVIYRDSDVLTIESLKGFLLQCNLQFDVCMLELSGWYFGKTAGVLGTMNNEKYDDMTTSNNQITQLNDQFVNSWSLPECSQQLQDQNYTIVEMKASRELREMCDSFFKSKSSFLAPCFSIVNAQPFYDMCLDLGTQSLANFINEKKPVLKSACTSALGYIQACEIQNTPMRVPDSCVHCDLINGTYVPEGSFISMKDDEIPQTTDVVFIVEAKACNKDIMHRKSIMSVVSALNKELESSKLKNNRYAVVAYGGESPFNKPRSINVNNKVFTDATNLAPYFEYIEMASTGNNDTFEAITIASKLIFRPGASKTFILIPCSKCMSRNMKFDYTAMLQLLLENGITLHTLMDKEFSFTKTSAARIVYGMDRNYAFTKQDLRGLVDDTVNRKQIRMPTNELGICSPLVMQTNGTIFQAKKLLPDNRNPVKRVCTVFAKRVARTAAPNACQTCECTGHNTGVAYMSCAPCHYPSPHMGDDGFNEDSMSSQQTDNNWEWDEEEISV